jgi:hypothetical protein
LLVRLMLSSRARSTIILRLRVDTSWATCTYGQQQQQQKHAQTQCQALVSQTITQPGDCHSSSTHTGPRTVKTEHCGSARSRQHCELC